MPDRASRGSVKYPSDLRKRLSQVVWGTCRGTSFGVGS